MGEGFSRVVVGHNPPITMELSIPTMAEDGDRPHASLCSVLRTCRIDPVPHLPHGARGRAAGHSLDEIVRPMALPRSSLLL